MRDGLHAAVRIGKAIDHPLRVRALAILREREFCVCELVELFGLAPSTISKHMSILADAGLVSRRRGGRWTYYSLPETPEEPIGKALELIDALVADDPVILKDNNFVPTVDCREEALRGR